jgi:hypothetical protein
MQLLAFIASLLTLPHPPGQVPAPVPLRKAALMPATLTDFWNGNATWQLDIFDVGLPVGESDTVHVEGSTYWSYLHASYETSGVQVLDRCGNPVAFPGCVTRWESHDAGQSFTISEPVCLFACESCPCAETEEPPINLQQYPRVLRSGDKWYMVYEWYARVQFLTSTDGLNWSEPQEIYGTSSWPYESGVFGYANCAGTVEEIGTHPNISWRAADCFNGGPPGIWIEDDRLYVIVGVGMNPAHLGCWSNRLEWGAGGMQQCEHILLTGASEYGPLDASGEDAAPYWDFRTLSSAEVLREGGYYYMFYEGIRGPSDPENPIDDQFGLGLARRHVSEGIDGPWEPYPANPLLDGLPGNVGVGHADVVNIDGWLYLYTATSETTRGRYVLVRR